MKLTVIYPDERGTIPYETVLWQLQKKNSWFLCVLLVHLFCSHHLLQYSYLLWRRTRWAYPVTGVKLVSASFILCYISSATLETHEVEHTYYICLPPHTNMSLQHVQCMFQFRSVICFGKSIKFVTSLDLLIMTMSFVYGPNVREMETGRLLRRRKTLIAF